MTPLARTTGLAAWGTTVLRVVTGMVLIMHGAQKFILMSPSAVAGFLGGMGVPMPQVAVWLVIGAEFGCGLLILCGAFTRLAAIPPAINMSVAITLVHLRAGFFLPNGYEFAMMILTGLVTLMLQGSGALAVDGLLRKDRV